MEKDHNYNKYILPVPWHFVTLGFQYNEYNLGSTVNSRYNRHHRDKI